MPTTIRKVDADNLEISLSDDSVWTPVTTGDISKAIIWYPSQRITIEEKDGIVTMTNHDVFEDGEIEVSRLR